MTFSLPPAVRLAEGLARDIEKAAVKWRREHKYTHGARIRNAAWDVLTTANRAALRPAQRAQLLQQLVDQVDDLKQALQLGKQLSIFHSFGQYEAIYRAAQMLGQQVGGWHKQHHPQGRNGQVHSPGQRAKTLSTHAASMHEANR